MLIANIDMHSFKLLWLSKIPCVSIKMIANLLPLSSSCVKTSDHIHIPTVCRSFTKRNFSVFHHLFMFINEFGNCKLVSASLYHRAKQIHPNYSCSCFVQSNFLHFFSCTENKSIEMPLDEILRFHQEFTRSSCFHTNPCIQIFYEEIQ